MMRPPDRAALRQLLPTGSAERSKVRRRQPQLRVRARPRLDGSDHLFDMTRAAEMRPSTVRRSSRGSASSPAADRADAVRQVARAWWGQPRPEFRDAQNCAPTSTTRCRPCRRSYDRGFWITRWSSRSRVRRTPQINGSLGRRHFASAWSARSAAAASRCALYGKTDEKGLTVVEGEIDAGDLFATIFTALAFRTTRNTNTAAGDSDQRLRSEPSGSAGVVRPSHRSASSASLRCVRGGTAKRGDAKETR